jgi:hypothetical protein
MGAAMNLTSQQKNAALEALAEENGDLDADRVWKAARSENHPLHGYFPWDVKEAAVEHWRYIARGIIASCRVEITFKETKFEVPKYIRNPSLPPQQQGYSLTQRVANEEDRARVALEVELSRAESALRRAVNLARAFDMLYALESLLGDIAKLRMELSEEREAKRRGKKFRHDETRSDVT